MPLTSLQIRKLKHTEASQLMTRLGVESWDHEQSKGGDIRGGKPGPNNVSPHCHDCIKCWTDARS